MPPIDLRAATQQMSATLAGVPDDALDAPTPCEGMTVGQLVGTSTGSPRCSPTRPARTGSDDGHTARTPTMPTWQPGWQDRAAGTSPRSPRRGRPRTRGTA
jgi:hypothetical protein